MPNTPNSMPATFDTDFTSFFAIQTLQAQIFGLRVWKIALYTVGVSVAGTVNITDPNDNTQLLAPMAVPAGSAAGTVLFFDNPTQLLQWRDFKITGLSATGTRLMVWYRV
jgi:hypothetical protein